MKTLQWLTARSLTGVLFIGCNILQAIVVVYPPQSSTSNQNSIEKNEFSIEDKGLIKDALENFTWPRAAMFRRKDRQQVEQNIKKYSDLLSNTAFAESKFIQKLLNEQKVNAVVTEVPNVIWDLFYINLYLSDAEFRKLGYWSRYFKTSSELGKLIAAVDTSNKQIVSGVYTKILGDLLKKFQNMNDKTAEFLNKEYALLENGNCILSLILAEDIESLFHNQACFYRATDGVKLQFSSEDLQSNITHCKNLDTDSLECMDYQDYLKEKNERFERLYKKFNKNVFFHNFCKTYFTSKDAWAFRSDEDAFKWGKAFLNEANAKKTFLLAKLDKEGLSAADLKTLHEINAVLSDDALAAFEEVIPKGGRTSYTGLMTATKAYALDAPLNLSGLRVFQQLTKLGTQNVKDLSYALTFLGGYIRSESSCSYKYFKNSFSAKYSNRCLSANIVYAVFVDKKWAYTRGVYLIHLPKEIIGSDVDYEGGCFHPHVHMRDKNDKYYYLYAASNMLSFVANPNFEITPNSLIAKKCPELSPEERCRCAFGLEVAAWLAHHSKVLAYKQVPLTETNKNKKEFAEIVADAEQLVPNQKILYELLYTVVRKPSLPQDLKTIHLKKVIKPNKESEIEIKK